MRVIGSKVIRVPGLTCPLCGFESPGYRDAAGGPPGPLKAGQGSVCEQCFGIAVVKENFHLRTPTEGDFTPTYLRALMKLSQEVRRASAA